MKRVPALLLALLTACGNESPDPRTNLLIVTLDTTRVDGLGCYGGPVDVSPTIDRFASEGVRFLNAYSCVPLTLPAHSSLFTGRYPDEHGVRTNTSYRLAEEQLTLAEILAQEGYQTAAFVAAYVLDHQFGLDQGFEHYDDQLEDVAPGEKVVAERAADEVTGRVLAWLEERDTRRPFFVWLHYYDPHYPHEVPAGEPRRHVLAYHDEIAFVDEQLARLRQRLEQRGEWANTLVVLTADHGEGQGEHGETTHGYFIYQATQHIPLILVHPALPAGQERRRNASLVDVLPTVLEFLGVGSPVCSGEDLLAGPDERSQPLFMEAELGRITFGLSPLRGVLVDSYKLIDTPLPELYELSSDPAESTNLAGKDGLRVERLRALLSSRPRTDSSLASSPARPGGDERLQALGYTLGAGNTVVTRTQWSSEQLARWSRLSNAGMQFYLAGQHSLAVEALQPVVDECPEAYACQVYLGMSLVRSGALQRGMLHLERAAELQPDASADVWWDIATGRAMGGQPGRARRALERVIALQPGHLGALKKLAQFALQAREEGAARGYLESIESRAPQSEEAHWARKELRKLAR